MSMRAADLGPPGATPAAGSITNAMLATPPRGGTLAARPAADGTQGLYWANDVCGGALYLDTGTWKLVGPSVGLVQTAPVTFNATSQAAATDVTLFTGYTIPANFCAVGTSFEIIVGLDIDLISNAGAKSWIFKVKFGATSLMGNMSFTCKASTAANNRDGLLHLPIITCQTTGAGGKFRAQGLFEIDQGVITSATAATVTPTTAVAGTTIDTTAAQAVTVTVQESINTDADLVRCDTALMRLVA